MIPVTHQTPIIRIQDQAQACEAIARNRATIIAALRKAGVQEAQARVVVEGVEAAGRTLRAVVPVQDEVRALVRQSKAAA